MSTVITFHFYALSWISISSEDSLINAVDGSAPEYFIMDPTRKSLYLRTSDVSSRLTYLDTRRQEHYHRPRNLQNIIWLTLVYQVSWGLVTSCSWNILSRMVTSLFQNFDRRLSRSVAHSLHTYTILDMLFLKAFRRCVHRDDFMNWNQQRRFIWCPIQEPTAKDHLRIPFNCLFNQRYILRSLIIPNNRTPVSAIYTSEWRVVECA